MATAAFITAMDWPLGHYIGNALEIFEVVQALNGTITDDIKELVLKFGKGKCPNHTRHQNDNLLVFRLSFVNASKVS